MKIVLPFPPSTNTYYRNVAGRTLISAKGREFRRAVADAVLLQRRGASLTDPLNVTVTLFPPDRRKRDLDNVGGKALLDAMQHAGVYADDCQIKRLVLQWGHVTNGGSTVVTIEYMA